MAFMTQYWRRAALIVLGAALVSGLFGSLKAQAPIIVRMATLVPQGSVWELILKETGERWKKASGGRVTVRLNAGGTMGDDPEVVRKMRIGSIDAAVLTAVGLAEIDKSVYALGVPMMYASYEELYYTLDKLRPRLEATLEKKDYVVLNWADGGWVHFFAKTPVAVPDDLRKQKLFSWAGDTDSLEIWKAAGFNPVPLPSTELSSALKTGLVTAFGSPPQVAVISNYYVDAKNLTDVNWALLLGATVIRKSVWDKLPADAKPAMLEAAKDAGRRLQADIRGSFDKDIEAMKKNGLRVVAVDAKARAQWVKMAENTYPSIRGKIVPADVFDEAMRYRDEFRRLGK